jgi:pSer/pThr/pTyr-binding forkhead associated (FHA) protein
MQVKGADMIDSPGQSADAPSAGPAAVAALAELVPVELIILDHYARKSRCLVGSLPAILGRGEKDDVQLTDPWISHSHCEIFRHGGTLLVRDLDSKNGVFIRGVRVRESEVLPGDCLTLGRTEITFGYQHATPSEDSAAGSTDSAPVAPAPGARRPNSGGPITEELLY